MSLPSSSSSSLPHELPAIFRYDNSGLGEMARGIEKEFAELNARIDILDNYCYGSGEKSFEHVNRRMKANEEDVAILFQDQNDSAIMMKILHNRMIKISRRRHDLASTPNGAKQVGEKNQAKDDSARLSSSGAGFEDSTKWRKVEHGMRKRMDDMEQIVSTLLQEMEILKSHACNHCNCSERKQVDKSKLLANTTNKTTKAPLSLKKNPLLDSTNTSTATITEAFIKRVTSKKRKASSIAVRPEKPITGLDLTLEDEEEEENNNNNNNKESLSDRKGIINNNNKDHHGYEIKKRRKESEQIVEQEHKNVTTSLIPHISSDGRRRTTLPVIKTQSNTHGSIRTGSKKGEPEENSGRKERNTDRKEVASQEFDV